MPHYWFDLSDNGSTHAADPDGLHLDQPGEVGRQALTTLAEMARDQKGVRHRMDLDSR
jgi:hypothetical protein